MIKINRFFQRISVKLWVTTFLFWSSHCIFYVFLVSFLTENGYSSFQCGVVTTIMQLSVMVFQPLLGYFTDTFITPRKLCIFCFILSIPLVLCFAFSVHIFPVILLLMAFISALNNAIYTVMDYWTVQLRVKYPDLNYGIIRSGGSWGYAFTALIFGNVIAQFGYMSMFYSYAVILAIVIACCFFLPDVPCLNKVRKSNGQEAQDEKPESFGQAIHIFWKTKSYVWIVVILFLYYFCVKAHQTFLPIILARQGGDSTHLGIAIFIGAVVEAVVMCLVSVLLRRGHSSLNMLLFCMVATTLRYITYAMPLPLWLTICLQVLIGAATGTCINITVDLVSKMVPAKLLSTGLNVYAAIAVGFGGLMGNFIGGAVIDLFGLNNYLFMVTGINLAAITIFCFVFKFKHNKLSVKA